MADGSEIHDFVSEANLTVVQRESLTDAEKLTINTRATELSRYFGSVVADAEVVSEIAAYEALENCTD